MSGLNTRLKELRLEKHLTQEQLGKVIGVTKASVSGYEKGTREPDTQSIKTLANYFEVTTDYLLGNSNSKNKSDNDPDLVANHLDINYKDLNEDQKKQVNDFIKFMHSQDKNGNGLNE